MLAGSDARTKRSAAPRAGCCPEKNICYTACQSHLHTRCPLPETLIVNLAARHRCGGLPRSRKTMPQELDTQLNHLYEVRSPETCTVTDSSGILLSTAIPGCVAEFFGDGHPVVLSSDAAVMRELPYRPEFIPWKLVNFENIPDGILNLNHKKLYRAGELRALVLRVDAQRDDFFCDICFTSGTPPTALTVPADWKWSGDHLSDGVFVPQPNTRYRLVILSDGVFIRASVQGVKL